MIAVMWSTVSAGRPQYAQSGLFDRMIARLRLYSVLACSLPIATARWRACSHLFCITLHDGLGLSFGLLSVCQLYV